MPHLITFIFVIFVYVIAGIANIHPVYGAGVWTHNLLVMSHLPSPLDHGFSPFFDFFIGFFLQELVKVSPSNLPKKSITTYVSALRSFQTPNLQRILFRLFCCKQDLLYKQNWSQSTRKESLLKGYFISQFFSKSVYLSGTV